MLRATQQLFHFEKKGTLTPARRAVTLLSPTELCSSYSGLSEAMEAASATPVPICIIVLGKTRSLPERRLGTSVMAGSPVPRVEDRGVVE